MARALTVQYMGCVNALITDCGVSEAFDPLKEHIKDAPLIHHFRGLWDTGATGSVISKKVITTLNLTPIDKRDISHAQGKSVADIFMVNIALPNKVVVPMVKVAEGVLEGFDVLIGMDIISRGDFAISQKDGKTKFSFEMPPTRDVDFVQMQNEEREKQAHTPIVTEKKPRPNDPCPCGSGLKYKKCHGKVK